MSPALRAIGNLILGDDEQTQAIVDAGVLAYAPKLLSNDRSSIVKEGCWMLSNITAGNTKQIQAVMDANLVPSVLKLMEIVSSLSLRCFYMYGCVFTFSFFTGRV